MMLRSLALSTAIHILPLGVVLMHPIAEEDLPQELPEAGVLEAAAGGQLESSAPFNIAVLEERASRKQRAPISPPTTPPAAPAPALPEPAPAAEVQEEPTPEPAEAIPEQEQPANADQPAAEAPRDECPPDPPGITEISSASWAVDRSLVDFYAGHIKELMKLAWVGVHKDEAGKPDGFRIILKKCSILRSGGLQSSDIVLDVGGVRVHSVLSAIKAYFKLRRQETIPLTVKRGDQTITLSYRLEKKS